jgi:Uncharacterized protein conserved in bacteria
LRKLRLSRARALWIATELLASFQFDIEAIVLKGASDGRFEVGFGKQRLFSKSATGRFPDPDELRLAIFALIDAKAS